MTDTLGKQVGKVMVRSIEMAYADGQLDARLEIEQKVMNIPVRMRTGVALIPLAEVLRIVNEGYGTSDGENT